MPFSFVAPVVAGIAAVDQVVDAVETVGSWFDDGPEPQRSGSSGGGGGGSSSSNPYGGGSPIPNLSPQIIRGSTADFDLGGNFYAAGHQVHDPIPHRMQHGNPMENFEGDFGGFDNFPHFAQGGHNPQFFSEGGLQNRYVRGEGDGTSDGVPAMLATGEFVIPADVVSALGNGDNDSGAGVLDNFMVAIRSHKQDHDPEELPPDSAGPLEYLRMATQTEVA
jgi:hypothetical protein